MFWSKSFIPTLKEAPQEADSLSHKLMLRAGLIRMLLSGVYSYLPLGLIVLRKIERIIREEMASAGAAELLLPALQPLDLWVQSGREKDIGEVMIRFTDRRGRKICLGPTHEEVITDLVKSQLSSYKQLPVVLYQIQTKFRDEIRPRFGLIRGCEFIMKDAYSFDRDEAGLDKNYKLMFEAYKRVFTRCGLKFLTNEADSGVMGGKVSHEFMVPAENGEDQMLVCRSCGLARTMKEGEKACCVSCGSDCDKINCIEVGHIFKLGTKYSQALAANFLDAQGKQQPVIMGCYGIGVSRLIPTIIEQNHDQNGIIWPSEITPYRLLILPLDVQDEQVMKSALQAADYFRGKGVEVLLDDRDERAGVKFKDADLIGVPLQLIVGREAAKNDKLELKVRKDNSRSVESRENILNQACSLLGI